ncbi:LysR family transcriptional regulator [Streptomyces zingiberis]|uniref:LysR family transcriptional regulator n=1 Tax=Streptomyces zingiberis TaxID=2053010 RepID=A0ABX1C167_9ACTN|nr:LysR family transcriptional regulator [Streptomyces zingiberis]NJQ03158.1 LysR family transcriptional regulator [Streptomyces zingiberis]
MTHIERLDLNLLVPLMALLEERNVSRAARRVHLSQPAMSRTLRRLRETFDDDLLVRSPSGYRRTPCAERLQQQLAVLLPQIADLFTREDFSPGTAAETFRLTGTDYAASVIGEELFRTVMQLSPQSRLHYRPWHEGVFDDLQRGAMDLAFFGSEPPASLRAEPLFTEEFVCVRDREHAPAGHAPLDLADYLRAVHVVVDISHGMQGIVDASLRRAGVERTVGLTVPYHYAALQAVARTPLVATLPRRLLDAGGAGPSGTFHVVPAPAAIDRMTYLMLWHPRLDNDPAHRWLRQMTRAAAGGSAPGTGPPHRTGDAPDAR